MSARPDIVEDEEAYNSASDEDFNPEAQPQHDESSSSDDDVAELPTSTQTKKTSKRARKQNNLYGDLDSGDEVTIQDRKKKRRKRDGDSEFLSDDEGGDGGFVKTRTQRRNETVERRALASTAGATVDVDALWSTLSGIPVGRPPEVIEAKPADNEDDYITIKRTTKFAGQVTTEERRVLKSSAEAKLYLAEQEAKKKKQETENQQVEEREEDAAEDVSSGAAKQLPLRRPLKRPLRFDPNPTGEVKGLPLNLQLRWPRDRRELTTAPDENAINNPRALPKLPAAAKLNTVQKSKYDWASYVDKAKLAEELDEYGKSKQSYAGRTDFLNRLESRREEERREARQRAA